MRLLDLFCGAGGAAMGYHQAGFTEIVGIDIVDQPNYPFDFVRADALRTPVRLRDFDLIHASPPCQHFTKYRNAVPDITDRYEDHLGGTLALLRSYPAVIENVPGAPLHADLILCGSHFGLDIRRHRHFQLNEWDSFGPGGCNHKGWTRQFKSGTDRPNLRYTIEIGAWDEPLDRQKQAMGIDWQITVRELSEAVPPAYTKYIGEQFLATQCPTPPSSSTSPKSTSRPGSSTGPRPWAGGSTTIGRPARRTTSGPLPSPVTPASLTWCWYEKDE